MKFWITKYALTAGIEEVEADDPALGASPGMLTVPGRNGSYRLHFHKEGRDWHRTIDAAVARAKRMKTDKIYSLHKSIKRLEAKQF